MLDKMIVLQGFDNEDGKVESDFCAKCNELLEQGYKLDNFHVHKPDTSYRVSPKPAYTAVFILKHNTERMVAPRDPATITL